MTTTAAAVTTAATATVPAATLADNRRSGLGDLSAALSYSFEVGGGFYADLTGKVKLPTAAPSKRLGTGKVDFTASMDLSYDVGPASLYVTARRKFAGKPSGSAIRSTWGAGGGASVRATKIITVGADYDWQQASFMGGKGSSEVTGWAYLRLTHSMGVTIYAGTGLNDASAAVMGGATITFRF